MQMTVSSKHETPSQWFRKYPSVSPTVNASLSQEIRVMAGGRRKPQGQNSWQPRAPPCKCTQDLILLLQNQWDAQDVEFEYVHNHRLSQHNCYFVFRRHVFGLWLQWFSLCIVNVSRSFLWPHAVLDLFMQKKGGAVVGVGSEGLCSQESTPLPREPQHNPPNPGRNGLSNLFLWSV